MITDDHKADYRPMMSSVPSSACATPSSSNYRGDTASNGFSSSSESGANEVVAHNPKKRKPIEEPRSPSMPSKAPHPSINGQRSSAESSSVYRHRSRASVASVSSGGVLSPPSFTNSGTTTAATSPQSSVEPSIKVPTMESFTFRANPAPVMKTNGTMLETSAADYSNTTLPVIHRIIPSSGSVRGGIEVTLLGTGFINGLVAKFGDNRSMATHVWNSTTVVAHLPPSHVAGPVVVSFDGWIMSDSQVFSYYDDTDQQLIELALQVVGLKMNGKMEDARDIARRIIGNSTGLDAEQLQSRLNNTYNNHSSSIPPHELEHLLMKCFDLIDFDTNSNLPSWQLANDEGQTMLHLAAILGLDEVCSELVDRGARTDAKDKSGFTPLHFAALHQHDDLVQMLMHDPSELLQKAYTGQTALDLAGEKMAEALFNRYIQPFKHSRNNSAMTTPYSSDGDDESDEESVDADNEEALVRAASREQPQPGQLMRRGIADYFAGLRDNARTSYQGFIENQQQQPFWNHFLPDRLTHREPSTSEPVPPPPSYHEIFPEGNDRPIDYSNAVIENETPSTTNDDKPRTTTNEQEATTNTETTTEEPEETTAKSEEEVLEAWNKKRKQLNNDRMLFFFWLPVFIFTLVWFSMKLVAYMNSVDTDSVKQQFLDVVKTIIGVGKKTSHMLSNDNRQVTVE
ncbi:hypothetical protein TRICI_005017 [Trichomonascus ciferrii]|uniref:IPT/TIG domain-containing protein n=1 Tax=Trichomonascus ciferrii TaxID=44093 RepID=A0A642V3V6_9ASCO|nr:hypothetical protein TRICI_005017 [Trichomonascus ciferrii]